MTYIWLQPKKQRHSSENKSKKSIALVKAEHYYVKALKLGLFVIENQELNVGDKILISGPTTGNQELVLEKMFVNGTENSVAKVGDKVTFEVPFK